MLYFFESFLKPYSAATVVLINKAIKAMKKHLTTEEQTQLVTLEYRVQYFLRQLQQIAAVNGRTYLTDVRGITVGAYRKTLKDQLRAAKASIRDIKKK